MKRHRLKVHGDKAEQLEQRGKSLVCPKCSPESVLTPISTFRKGVWVHIGDVCPRCGYEFSLKDAPN